MESKSPKGLLCEGSRDWRVERVTQGWHLVTAVCPD